MKPITPPTPTHRIMGHDPETGETHYYLRPIEKAAIWFVLAILYIAHAAAICGLSILIYTNQKKKMETKQKTVYISGPVANIPHGNVVDFADATRAVRNMGHIAKNPHEFCADIPRGTPWETFMRRCLQQLMDCTDIILLPGWENSDGSSLEHMNASIVGITIHDSIEGFRESHVKGRTEDAPHG